MSYQGDQQQRLNEQIRFAQVQTGQESVSPQGQSCLPRSQCHNIGPQPTSRAAPAHIGRETGHTTRPEGYERLDQRQIPADSSFFIAPVTRNPPQQNVPVASAIPDRQPGHAAGPQGNGNLNLPPQVNVPRESFNNPPPLSIPPIDMSLAPENYTDNLSGEESPTRGRRDNAFNLTVDARIRVQGTGGIVVMQPMNAATLSTEVIRMLNEQGAFNENGRHRARNPDGTRSNHRPRRPFKINIGTGLTVIGDRNIVGSDINAIERAAAMRGAADALANNPRASAPGSRNVSGTHPQGSRRASGMNPGIPSPAPGSRRVSGTVPDMEPVTPNNVRPLSHSRQVSGSTQVTTISTSQGQGQGLGRRTTVSTTDGASPPAVDTPNTEMSAKVEDFDEEDMDLYEDAPKHSGKGSPR
ncbi:hypothetical protein K504DRAFT_492318 [Pleomassaria siparia CBS 279.74]|uniref:Uncharacterized protein n=1 Tax=Pleomassaria siparia CBS 279.74 TaxID=1314801 RepID=A0A6G1K5C4_9PLEO|nr:hypothetical protein K504DRAFT_492318 [Pleomassaria siparia CBS 279.74]